jgi:hypothetical protein
VRSSQGTIKAPQRRLVFYCVRWRLALKRWVELAAALAVNAMPAPSTSADRVNYLPAMWRFTGDEGFAGTAPIAAVWRRLIGDLFVTALAPGEFTDRIFDAFSNFHCR